MILALDLARVTGFAYGRPGEVPAHGSIQFGSASSSHEACFSKAYSWMNGMLDAFHPTTVVWEAPLAGFKFGKTNVDTTTILFGLPAVIGLAAFEHRIFDIRKADTRAVRQHFIGANPKRAKAKPS